MTTNNGHGDGSGAELQPAVEAEYLALAALLESLSEEEWDTPSLCAGWRIREVAAHVTMPARYDQERFTAELRACSYDFGALSDKIAARDAALPTAELVAGLRSRTLHHFTSPDGGWQGALSHAVIHGLDMAVPLGAAGRVPPARVTAVLDGLARGGVAANFGVRLDGRGLRATDLDWSFGSGPVLSGTAEDLVLALTGRTLPPGHLAGEPL